MVSSTSIVVVSHNKRSELAECIASVQQLAPQAVKTIVVDNDSRDGSADMIASEFPDVLLIRSPSNSGAAGGRNLGAQEAVGDVILFLDDDAEAFPDSLAAISECLDLHPEVGIVCGKTFGRAPQDLLMSTGIAVELGRAAIWDIGAGGTDRGQYDAPCEVAACGAFALAIRSDVFDALGGFDDAFNPYGWEDVDICLRARRAGYKTLYWPKALFRHKGTRQGRPAVVSYELAKARNFIRIMGRYATGAEWLSCNAYLPVRAVKVLCKVATGAFGSARRAGLAALPASPTLRHQSNIGSVAAGDDPLSQRRDPTS